MPYEDIVPSSFGPSFYQFLVKDYEKAGLRTPPATTRAGISFQYQEESTGPGMIRYTECRVEEKDDGMTLVFIVVPEPLTEIPPWLIKMFDQYMVVLSRWTKDKTLRVLVRYVYAR